jgi:hypothetical protein
MQVCLTRKRVSPYQHCRYTAQEISAPAVTLLCRGVAADKRGPCAGSPQLLRPVLQLRDRRRLVQAVVRLLLQNANPGFQQVLLRVATHEQCCIEEEVPAQAGQPYWC